MGTPDFAVPCLERLITLGHTVSAVFSQPDKPKGRGYGLAAPPVKLCAQSHSLPVYQPTRLRDGTVRDQLLALAPDVIVVVAYGRLLPPDILAVPALGCINIHASLLPKLRGAAPIQWSVINGDTVTGVTAMYMAEGLDTGDMILQKETDIGPQETAGELFDRLSALGADCLAEALPLLAAGTAPRTHQNDKLATLAPPIAKDMAFLDFTQPPAALCHLVRGLNPAPMAKTYLDGKLLRVFAARPVADYQHTEAPGTLLDKKRFLVACTQGAVEFLTIQPEGKKVMEAGAFLAGRRGAGGVCRPHPAG